VSVRLAVCLALAWLVAAPNAAAHDGGRGEAGLSLNPGLLSTPALDQTCTTRRVTGPRGAYRWDRIECPVDPGWRRPDPGLDNLDVVVEVRSERDRYASRDAEGRLAWPGKPR
jgi:hypothetical protein